MARWVKWEIDEFDLLIELVEREGFNPSRRSLEELATELRHRGADRTARAFDPSFRSVASIGSQLYRLELLARGDPRGEEQAPPAMQAAWLRRSKQDREGARALVEAPYARQEREATGSGYEEDRLALIEFLDQLRSVFRELDERAASLIGAARAEEFREAWVEIDGSGVFEAAGQRLGDPEVGPALVTYGLVGAPRRLKTNGFRQALRRLTEGWTWPRIKPMLKWANITLGSLVNVMAMIDPVKEFKEAWEAAADEAYE